MVDNKYGVGEKLEPHENIHACQPKTRCKNLNIFPFPTESQIPKSQNLQKVYRIKKKVINNPELLGVGRSSKSQVPQSENEVYQVQIPKWGHCKYFIIQNYPCSSRLVPMKSYLKHCR